MNGVLLQIDVDTDKAMRPIGIYRKAMAKNADVTAVAGATEKDDRSLRKSFQIQRPGLGKRWTGRRGFDSVCCPAATRGDELGGLGLQRLSRGKDETKPNLQLPTAVEAFDRGLKTRFPRGSEHGNDSQGKAQPRNASA